MLAYLLQIIRRVVEAESSEDVTFILPAYERHTRAGSSPTSGNIYKMEGVRHE